MVRVLGPVAFKKRRWSELHDASIQRREAEGLSLLALILPLLLLLLLPLLSVVAAAAFW